MTPRGREIKKIMAPPDPFEPMTLRASVLAAFFDVRRRKLAHSVQFVDISERDQEEIQRFIHVWQSARDPRTRAHARRVTVACRRSRYEQVLRPQRPERAQAGFP